MSEFITRPALEYCAAIKNIMHQTQSMALYPFTGYRCRADLSRALNIDVY